MQTGLTLLNKRGLGALLAPRRLGTTSIGFSHHRALSNKPAKTPILLKHLGDMPMFVGKAPTFQAAMEEAKKTFYLPKDSNVQLVMKSDGIQIALTESVWDSLEKVMEYEDRVELEVKEIDESGSWGKRKKAFEEEARAAQKTAQETASSAREQAFWAYELRKLKIASWVAQGACIAAGLFLVSSVYRFAMEMKKSEPRKETYKLKVDTPETTDKPTHATSPSPSLSPSNGSPELLRISTSRYCSAPKNHLEFTCDPKTTTIGFVRKEFNRMHQDHDPTNCHKKGTYCSRNLVLDLDGILSETPRDDMTVEEWLDILRQKKPRSVCYKKAYLAVEGWHFSSSFE